MVIPDRSVDILLVEDDANDAELAMMALRQRNIAKKVVHVLDGTEALDFIYSSSLFGNWDGTAPPKLILLDLKLKTVSGLEVLKKLKSEDHTKTIPIVVFTASSEEIAMVESYRLGVNSYVIKPSDFNAYSRLVGDIGHYWLNVNHPPEFGT